MLWITVLLLAFGPGLARAQEIDPGYRIGTDDVIRVDVPTRTDMSGRYTVGSDGQVTLPVIGPVPVSGRTAAELAAELSRRVSLFSRDIPRVTVMVVEARSRKVLVLGSVLVPGVYPMPESMTIWEAILKAGGVTEDADLSAVQIIPSDAEPLREKRVIDLARALRESHPDSLERVRPGETVRVPSSRIVARSGRDEVVSVFGAVQAQGTHPLSAAPDLLTAVIRCGGPTPDANLKKVEIIRHDGSRVVHMRVNLRQYIDHADGSGYIALQPGDAIFLPRSTPRIGAFFSVLGMITPILALGTSVIAITRTR